MSIEKRGWQLSDGRWQEKKKFADDSSQMAGKDRRKVKG